MFRYSGTGTVTFTGLPNISGNFELIFDDNSKARLSISTINIGAAFSVAQNANQSGVFRGISNNHRCNIEIDVLYFGSLTTTTNQGQVPQCIFNFDLYHPIKVIFRALNNQDRVRIRRGLANFVFYGNEVVKRRQHHIRGKTSFIANGKKFFLYQAPNFERKVTLLKKNRNVAETGRLYVGCKFIDLKDTQDCCQNVETLLALASGNYVVPLYEDIYRDNRLCVRYLYPLKTYPFSGNQSPIDLSPHATDDLKLFIESTYPNFITLKDFIGLSYVLELFISSKMQVPIEAKYLLMSTAFECLEAYYRTWRGLPEINSLVSKLRRMFTGGLPVVYNIEELRKYRVNRNNLIHEGKFPITSDKFSDTRSLENLVERVFLSFLGYRNKPYYNTFTRRRELLP